MNKNKESSLTSLKLNLYSLLNDLDEQGELSDSDSEILFQLSNDPELENLIAEEKP
jgi:hypothetical protein